MTVDELDKKLMRPIYNFRMGNAAYNSQHSKPGFRKAGLTKRERARIEIEEIMYDYAWDMGWIDGS